MQEKWYKGTKSPEERERRKLVVTKSTEFIELLRDELLMKKAAIEAANFAPDNFGADWPHTKSHNFGYLHALVEILKDLPTQGE